MPRPQSNQRGIETDAAHRLQRLQPQGLNRTSVGLKRGDESPPVR